MRGAARIILSFQLLLLVSLLRAEFSSPLFPGMSWDVNCSVVLHRKGYDLCYSCETRTPLIAVYRLKKEDIVSRPKRKHRRRSFRPDWSLPARCRSFSKDYAGAGYDRGHLVPAAAFGDPARRKETFLMSNVAPQKPSLNRGEWAKIERWARIMAIRYGEVTVATGIRFGPKPERLRGRVAVPKEWFKVIRVPGNEDHINRFYFDNKQNVLHQ